MSKKQFIKPKMALIYLNALLLVVLGLVTLGPGAKAQATRSRGQNSNPGVVVRRHLENLRRVRQPMDFIQIQNESPLAEAFQKALGVFQCLTCPGTFTVRELCWRQGSRQHCLSGPPHTRKPDHGCWIHALSIRAVQSGLSIISTQTCI